MSSYHWTLKDFLPTLDRSSCRFMKLHENIWVYSVKHHISFSNMKISRIVSWLLLRSHNSASTTNHYGHVYLAPLHLRNPELQTFYKTMAEGSDEGQKEAIKDDYAKLKSMVKEGKFVGGVISLFLTL